MIAAFCGRVGQLLQRPMNEHAPGLQLHHSLLTGPRLARGAESVVPCSCRFLPDKAIDLIDEAGSRVRLRHAQLPEEARDLDKELRALLKEKEASVR